MQDPVFPTTLFGLDMDKSVVADGYVYQGYVITVESKTSGWHAEVRRKCRRCNSHDVVLHFGLEELKTPFQAVHATAQQGCTACQSVDAGRIDFIFKELEHQSRLVRELEQALVSPVGDPAYLGVDESEPQNIVLTHDLFMQFDEQTRNGVWLLPSWLQDRSGDSYLRLRRVERNFAIKLGEYKGWLGFHCVDVTSFCLRNFGNRRELQGEHVRLVEHRRLMRAVAADTA